MTMNIYGEVSPNDTRAVRKKLGDKCRSWTLLLYQAIRSPE
ncbi:hypothetical protein ACFFOP_19765 [Sinosporangium siamense]